MRDDESDPLEPDDAVLLRLLIGGGLEAGDELRRLVAGPSARSDDTTQDEPPALDVRARRVLLGVLFEAYDRVARTTAITARLVRGALDAGAFLLAPIRRSRLLAPVRVPFELGASLGLTLLRRWERLGTLEEERSRDVVRGVAERPVDRILEHLRENPEMQALVLKQAQELLAELQQSPQVDTLVQTQADRYVEHLRANPEPVRELISGQSIGLVGEVMNSLRYQAYRFDSLLEKVARTLLHRKPRNELPPPPLFVQRRAEFPLDDEPG